MSPKLQQEVLLRAAAVLGGKPALRERLRVAMRDLEAWMNGETGAPTDVFLIAVDIVAGGQADAMRQSLAAGRLRSKELHEQATQAKARALRLQEQSQQLVADVRTRILASRSTRNVGARFANAGFSVDEGAELLIASLDAALGATDAGKGNLQLLCPDGLRIVTHRGFQAPFLEFFACVGHGSYACGAAARAMQPVVVSDVASDPLFANNAGGRMLIDSGVRAVQSTPLISSTGELLGVMSTHFEDRRDLTDHERAAVTTIAGHTASWLEHALI